MATRLYLPSTGSVAVTPAISADWNAHINTVRFPLNVVKGSSAIATTTFTPDAADHLVAGRAHFAQFISDVLPPQAIAAQVVKLQLRVSEANAGNNLFVNWKIYAVTEDGQTELGTLLAVRADGTEAATTLTNRADSATTTAFTATEKFRLVLELGLGGTPTASSGVQGHNGSLSFGENAATDLPEDDASTAALNPWLQFANNLKLGFVVLTYTFIDRCEGGGHTRLDVAVNGGATKRLVYTTDEIREPLANLTADERDFAALVILKIHLAGKTRQEIIDEFAAGPVTVTI